MIALAWLLVLLWAAIFIASARPTLKRLPCATRVVPPYTLWLPDGGHVPELHPRPERTISGPTPPTEGPQRLLVLSGHLTVPTDLPGRFAACGADFVSAFPHPTGRWHRLAIERLRRDFAAPLNVINPRHPAAFADERCAWMRRADLALPAPGTHPVLRAARARKAYGLPIDLRDGRATPTANNPTTDVHAPAMTISTYTAGLNEMVAADGIVRTLLIIAPTVLCLSPLLLLPFADYRSPALLALGLGSAARLVTAQRAGFGYALAIFGWIYEPYLALAGSTVPWPKPNPMPLEPASAAPGLVAPKTVEGGRWLDAAALPYLARRLGGSAEVMELLYNNAPTGRTALGRAVDRAVHISPGARAVRHRLTTTTDLARALAPQRLLSVPCGTARDAEAINAPQMTLLDPDAKARALAQQRCPTAQVLAGRIEDSPEGPYDAILFVGLLEYLDDADTIQQLTFLRARLVDSGALIVTTTDHYPDRSRMARWLGWETKPRSPDKLAFLLNEAGYTVESRQSDPNQIQWTFLARPRPFATTAQPLSVD